jgi:transposase
MKADLTKIRKKRCFSEDFKRALVKDFESGQYSVVQLEKLHKISNNLIYDWIYKYSTFNDKSFRIVEMKESSANRVKELEAKIRELERTVGIKQLQIDYLEKMMDIAKEELGVDIKKNSDTPQSTGSEKTRKK